MPTIIKPVAIIQDVIEMVSDKCDCVRCEPNQFFSMVPYYNSKPCKKRFERITRFPGRIAYSTCILEFSKDEFVPIPDLSSLLHPYVPKHKYEFDIGGKLWTYHGVFTLYNNPSTPLVYECSVDWIESK